jgi:hypothetical protein
MTQDLTINLSFASHFNLRCPPVVNYFVHLSICLHVLNVRVHVQSIVPLIALPSYGPLSDAASNSFAGLARHWTLDYVTLCSHLIGSAVLQPAPTEGIS